MSNDAMSYFAKTHPGKGPKAVLMCLADRGSDHSGEDWTCFPSISDIMAWTDYSRPAVERNLLLLWRDGYISRKRRRRADGTLGIYDYTLHRDPERREALKAARAKVQDPDTADETASDAERGPDVKMMCGPCVVLDPTIRQNGPQPCVKMMGQEPSLEPSDEPTNGRAREPGDQGFDEAIALWPETGRKRTRWAKGRAAWARFCGDVAASRMIAAVKACAADPDMAKGDYGWPAFDQWLNDERWRAWLPPEGSAKGVVDAPRIRFAGPAELRAAIVADPALGEGFAGSFLDRARWDEAQRCVHAATGVAYERLKQAVTHFRAHAVLLGPSPTTSGGRP